MAKEHEAPTKESKIETLLELMLEDKGREIQERQKKDKETTEQRMAMIQSQIDAAKDQNERNKMRRDQCDGTGGPPHQTMNPANGTKRSAWRGQVNSDGTFSPVCCKCLMVMPKIKATDEQKKEGVNLGGYVELSVPALERWHKATFDGGCQEEHCYLCHPVKELAAV